jgi:hypothetical protein
MAMKRSELPSDILELWRYIDELSERGNRSAEHYEAVARAPAPSLSGRAESERIMGSIRGALRALADADRCPSGHRRAGAADS